jgi:hypothetical protein
VNLSAQCRKILRRVEGHGEVRTKIFHNFLRQVPSDLLLDASAGRIT